jgi:hypothetical protein
LLSTKGIDSPLDVLVDDGRRNLLDPHEVLLIQSPKALDTRFELF